jgi:hypothetical protein
MYTVEDAKKDMRTLIARLEALQDRQAVVAHLIELAIGHGVTPDALDRLNDALDELELPLKDETATVRGSL